MEEANMFINVVKNNDDDWIDDKQHGYRIWKDTCVYVYKGKWKENRRHGKSTHYWKPGKKYANE